MKIEPILDKFSTFQEFLPIVEETEPKLSWLGERFVYINSIKKKLSIDSAANHMIALLNQNSNFSQNDRVLVKKISNLIDRIYDKSDEQVSGCWFFMRLIVWIRDLCDSKFPYRMMSSAIRWSWRECKAINVMGYKHIQYLYTKEQFEKVFRYSPDSDCGVATFNGEARWLAPDVKMFTF